MSEPIAEILSHDANMAPVLMQYPDIMPKLRTLTVSPGFRSFVLDQLEDLGDVVARAMFGGVGLYCDGLFFGIIAADVLYLKVDDLTRPDYEAAGMEPFKPYADRSGTMQYYAVPLAVLESSAELVGWARKAVKVADHRRKGEREKGKQEKGRNTKGNKGRRNNLKKG